MENESLSVLESVSENNYGYLGELDSSKIGEVLLISLIAILIVFGILLIIITICSAFSKGIEIADKKTKILPREENALLEKDPDAVVASLVATIEFHREFKKDARLVSIKRID